MNPCEAFCVKRAHLALLVVQLSLEEVLGLAAAVEACSEHPLASAVLHFAAARLDVRGDPTPGSFEAELAAGLQQFEGGGEGTPLVGGTPSSSRAKRQRSPVATDWLQPATDIQVEEGQSHLMVSAGGPALPAEGSVEAAGTCASRRHCSPPQSSCVVCSVVLYALWVVTPGRLLFMAGVSCCNAHAKGWQISCVTWSACVLGGS